MQLFKPNVPTIFYITFSFLLIAGIIFLVVYEHTKEERVAPVYSEMRSYRISQLSDDEIRRLHERSVQDFEKEKREAADQSMEFWAKKRIELEKCKADIAYREKNPSNCTLPIMWQSIGEPDHQSPESIYEIKLMGMCLFVDSVKKAREYGCLPPRR